jgi:hypothetical protein
MGSGCRTNTIEELLALWMLIKFAKILGIRHLHVLGDSMVTVEWGNHNLRIKLVSLQSWCDISLDLFYFFYFILFQHIFREHNEIVDRLSKHDLGSLEGIMFFMEFLDNRMVSEGDLLLY